MARRAGALYRRLCDWSQVTAAVLEAVLRDHDCEGGDSCPVCGARVDREAVAVPVGRGCPCGALWPAAPVGRRVRPESGRQAAPDEGTAPALFDAEPFRKGGGG